MRSCRTQALTDRKRSIKKVRFIFASATRKELIKVRMKFQQPTDSIRRRYEAGKKLRTRLPREAQSRWAGATHRANPLTTLATVNDGRLRKLLPEKYKRMRVSPFSFFRGAAVLMGSDLGPR
jgi:hypothetical protein